MKYTVAQQSLTGARSSNQDRALTLESEHAVLLAVADGLGGHAGGALAADIFVQEMARAFRAQRGPRIERPIAFLAAGIEQAHRAIVAAGRAQTPPITPRTTCVLALVQDGIATWAHVGDSRLYHFRGAQLLARTVDHSVTETMYNEGLLDEAQMAKHTLKSKLTNCLGGPSAPEATYGRATVLERDDLLLLCTDGVWQAFSNDDLADFLSAEALEEGLDDMLDAAEKTMRKRCDNVTAVALRWRDKAGRLEPVRHARSSLPVTPSAARSVASPIDDELREIEKLLDQFNTRGRSA